MLGIEVNPATVVEGNKIAIRHHKEERIDRRTGKPYDVIVIDKTVPVKKVEACSTPEKVHVNGGCYDARFATLVIPK